MFAIVDVFVYTSTDKSNLTPQLHHPGQGKTLVSVIIQGSTRHSQAKTGTKTSRELAVFL